MAKKIRQIKRVPHYYCNYWQLTINREGEYEIYLDNSETVEREPFHYCLDPGLLTGRISFNRYDAKTDELHRKILLDSVVSNIDNEIARLHKYKEKLSRLL